MIRSHSALGHISSSDPAKAIIPEVAAKYGVEVWEMMVPVYERPESRMASRECFYRIRLECGYSYPRIGHIFGRHHTTIISAIQTYCRRNGLSVPPSREVSAVNSDSHPTRPPMLYPVKFPAIYERISKPRTDEEVLRDLDRRCGYVESPVRHSASTPLAPAPGQDGFNERAMKPKNERATPAPKPGFYMPGMIERAKKLNREKREKQPPDGRDGTPWQRTA